MRRNEEKMPARRDQGFGLSPWSESRSSAASANLPISPWQMMRRMQEDMDRIFGQVLSDGLSPAAGSTPAGQQLAPSMDISEDGKEWRIEVDLPGVKPDNVDVRLQDHQLILRAEIRPEEQEEQREDGGRRYLRQERRYGFIETVLPLPENVEEDAIRCEFRNGVLSVHLPKSVQRQEQARRIPVGLGTAPEENTTAQQDQPAPRNASAQQANPAKQRGSQGAGQEEEDQERPAAGAGTGRDGGLNNRS